MANVLNLLFKANTSEVKSAQKDLSDLKGRVSELAKEIPGLGAVTSSLGNSFGGLRSASSALAGGIVGVGIAATAAAVAIGGLGVAAAFSFQQKIDELSDMAAKLGITTNAAMALTQVLSDAGLSVNDLNGGVDRLNKAMARSGDEAKGAGEAFATLGVKTTDAKGNLRDNIDVMDELSRKYQDGNLTVAEQAALQQVLGKSYRESLLAFASAKEAADEYNSALEKGLGITAAAEAASSDFEKTMREGNKVALSMGSIFVEIVIPAFTSLAQWFIKSYTEGGAVAKVFNFIANTTRILVDSVSVLAQGLGTLVDTFVLIGDVGKKVFTGLWQAINGDFSSAMKTLSTSFDGVLNKLGAIGQRQLEVLRRGAQVGKDAVQTILTGGTDYVGNAQASVRSENKPKSVRDFISSSGAGGAPNATSGAQNEANAVEKLIETLNKQKISLENLSKEKMVQIELDTKLKGIGTEKQRADAISIARDIDSANAKKQLNVASEGLNKTAKTFVDRLEDEAAALRLNTRQLQQMRVEKELDRKKEEEVARLKERGLYTLEREEELLRAVAAAKAQTAEATAKAQAADDDWFGRGIDGYLKNMGTFNDAMANFTTKTMTGFGDMMTEMFVGGEVNFKSFVSSFLKGIVQMTTQMFIMKPIMEWLKTTMSSMSAGGGLGSIIGSFFGAAAHGAVFAKPHASGGVLGSTTYGMSGGTPWMGGESGDEAIVPLKRNAAGDLGVQVSGGKGGGSTIQINQTVNIGSVDSEERKTAMLREMQKNTEATIRKVLVDEQRRGGILGK